MALGPWMTTRRVEYFRVQSVTRTSTRVAGDRRTRLIQKKGEQHASASAACHCIGNVHGDRTWQVRLRPTSSRSLTTSRLRIRLKSLTKQRAPKVTNPGPMDALQQPLDSYPDPVVDQPPGTEQSEPEASNCRPSPILHPTPLAVPKPIPSRHGSPREPISATNTTMRVTAERWAIVAAEPAGARRRLRWCGLPRRLRRVIAPAPSSMCGSPAVTPTTKRLPTMASIRPSLSMISPIKGSSISSISRPVGRSTSAATAGISVAASICSTEPTTSITTADGLETRVDGAPHWNSSDGDRRRDGFTFADYGLAMPQLYGEIFAPIGSGLDVKLGHFYTILGYESVRAPENFFYSHSYTFQYGKPITHTGVLADWAFGSKLNVQFGYTRGWDNWEDLNGKPNYLAGFTWCPSRTASLAFALTTGAKIMRASTTAPSTRCLHPPFGRRDLRLGTHVRHRSERRV